MQARLATSMLKNGLAEDVLREKSSREAIGKQKGSLTKDLRDECSFESVIGAWIVMISSFFLSQGYLSAFGDSAGSLNIR